MRHRKAGLKLNRTSSHRTAMFRNMVTSLFKYDRIQTTDAKAKELRRWADRLITLAKRGDLHARRRALSIVREKDVVHKLFEDAPKRFGEVQGGYTRIVKIGRRSGDAAPVSLIELISSEPKEKKKKPAKKTKASQKKKSDKKAAPSAEKKEKVEEITESPAESKVHETAAEQEIAEQTAAVDDVEASEELKAEGAAEEKSGDQTQKIVAEEDEKEDQKEDK